MPNPYDMSYDDFPSVPGAQPGGDATMTPGGFPSAAASVAPVDSSNLGGPPPDTQGGPPPGADQGGAPAPGDQSNDPLAAAPLWYHVPPVWAQLIMQKIGIMQPSADQQNPQNPGDLSNILPPDTGQGDGQGDEGDGQVLTGEGPYGPYMTPEQGGGGMGPDVLPGMLPNDNPVSVQLNNPRQAADQQKYIDAHSVPGQDDYGA